MNDGSSATGEAHEPTLGSESEYRAPAERRAGTTDERFVWFFLSGQAAQLVAVVAFSRVPTQLWTVAALWMAVAAAYWLARRRAEGPAARADAFGAAAVLASYSLITVVPCVGYGYFATMLAVSLVVAATNVPVIVASRIPAAVKWRRMALAAAGFAVALALAAWLDR